MDKPLHEPSPENPFNKPKRPRISVQKSDGRLPAIDDPLEFTSNKSGEKAKKAFTYTENVQLEIMHHKHYHDRIHHGDENGKREGIDPQAIESLIRKSVKYLIACSTLVEGFSFVHHETNGGRPKTLVIQQGEPGDRLNVVIQAYFMSINRIEITVTTAMVEDNFRISMGQYVLNMNEGPILSKNINNHIVEIFEF